MSSVLTFELEEDPESFIEWIREAITLRAGTLIGDVNFGNFSFGVPLGELRGEYRVQEGLLTIKVTQKPLFVSGNELRSRFSDILQQRWVLTGAPQSDLV